MLQALIQDRWPTVLVNNDNCEEPSTTDEDYSGFQCTGTDIAKVNNRFVPTVSEWAQWGECGSRGRRQAAFGIPCPSHRRYQDGGVHGASVSSVAVTAPTSTY